MTTDRPAVRIGTDHVVQLRPYVDFREGAPAKRPTRVLHWLLVLTVCGALGFAVGSIVLALQ